VLSPATRSETQGGLLSTHTPWCRGALLAGANGPGRRRLRYGIRPRGLSRRVLARGGDCQRRPRLATRRAWEWSRSSVENGLQFSTKEKVFYLWSLA
jgi:hypothetical protein